MNLRFLLPLRQCAPFNRFLPVALVLFCGLMSSPTGGQITYSLAVSNAGPDDAANIVLQGFGNIRSGLTVLRTSAL